MLAIIISACLVNDPNVCKDHKVPLMFDKWAEDHPDWQIKKWRCGAASDQDT